MCLNHEIQEFVYSTERINIQSYAFASSSRQRKNNNKNSDKLTYSFSMVKVIIWGTPRFLYKRSEF